MPSETLNWLEINKILSELHLEGSRLKRVRQSDYRGIILEFSSPNDPSALALFMAPPYPRLHLLDAGGKLPRALSKPPRFAAVLKSRLEGGRLNSVKQLGKDRIVRLSFTRFSEELFLDVKLWGNSANIILCSPEGIVIDCYSRRPNRGEAPGEKWPPEGIGLPAASGTGGPKPYTLRPLPGEGSWNQRVEKYFSKLEKELKSKRRRELWEAHLARREDEIARKTDEIARRMKRFEGDLKSGHYADIIMAHLHEIDKHTEVLEAEDWDAPGTTLHIPLDKKLSPKENAEKYYRRQKRAVRGLERLKEDSRLLEQTRKHIGELKGRLKSGDIESEPFNTDPPVRKTKKGEKKEGLPGLWINRPPFIIAVGRSAKESDSLLRHWAKGNDLWLHLRDAPGAHVFIRAPRGKTVPLDILLDAGNLALSYSKAKTSREADLYYTHVKYLRRPRMNRSEKNSKSGKMATVLPTHEKNLHIRMDPKRLKALKEAAEIT